MKKEKRVEKWKSLGALSLVASLQERSTLQNRRRNRQDFLKGKTKGSSLRMKPIDVYAKKRVAREGVIEAAQRAIKKPST